MLVNRIVYWEADKSRAQSRATTGPSLGTQPSTDTPSSTAVTSAAEGRAAWKHRHHNPALLAFSRHLQLHHCPSYDEKKAAQN
jgi:hypothetical protein